MSGPSISPLFRLLTPLLHSSRRTPSTYLPRSIDTILPSTSRTFSSTPQTAAKNPKQQKKDPKIALLRYHLLHPKTPRPLRLSRTRSLRHWTIHRAWMLFKRNEREKKELELERMYKSMHNACEQLRLLDDPGTKDAGRLYRIAMEKKGIFGPAGVPIEYARAQTETPGREPWNHDWTR